MNKLQFYTGGHKLTLSQIEFLQTALDTAIKAIGNRTGSNFIVSGCERSPGSIEITPGAFVNTWEFAPGVVVINGEPCIFDGQWIVQTDYNAAFFQIAETNGTPAIEYKDGTIKNVYKIRKATIGNIGSTPNIPLFEDSRWLMPGSWEFLPLVGGVTGTSLRYRRHHDHLELQGLMTINSSLGGSGTITSTPLPVWARPNLPSAIVVHIVANNNTNDVLRLELGTNGHITIGGSASTGSGRSAVLNSMKFPLRLAAG